MSGAALPDELRTRRSEAPVNARSPWLPASGTTERNTSAAAALPLGGDARSDGSASFVVWAPAASSVLLRLHTAPPRTAELHSEPHGYHTVIVPDVAPGTRYTFELPDGSELPDPASRFQPDGVHGPSELTGTEFQWQTNDWRAPELRDLVIYEMHIGTFTREGTYDAAIARLDDLARLGAGDAETHAVRDVVEAALQAHEKILARDPGLARGGGAGGRPRGD